MKKSEGEIDRRQPFLKWYPADWRADPRLKLVSLAARGLWADILTFMHEADPYGYLIVEGVSLTKSSQLVGIVGRPASEVKKAFDELDRFKVFSRVGEDMPDDVKALIPQGVPHGTILSRRMVRDKAKRDKDRENGKRGGNPNLKPEGKPSDATGGITGEVKAQRPEARGQRPEARVAAATTDVDWVDVLQDACRSAGIDPGRAVNELKTAKDWSGLGLPPSAILRVIAEVAGRKGYRPPATLRYFTPMLEDAAKLPPPTQEAAAVDQLAINRDAAVAAYRKLGPAVWPEAFGPKPDEPGCLASPEVLQRHGFRPKDAA